MESRTSEKSQVTVKVASSNAFDQQDGGLGALEYNGGELPAEYLFARLSFTNKEAEQFSLYKKGKRFRDEDRRNTDFYFHLADIYNKTNSSFNQYIADDGPDFDGVDEGLEKIVREFQHKAEFLQVVKQVNKNRTKEVTDAKGVYSVFVRETENYGNLPLPLLLKIRNGIFFVPSLYTITEGIASALHHSLKELNQISGQQLTRAILQRNNMPDIVHALLLRGFQARPEFTSLVSSKNEVGEKTATVICELI